MHRPFFVALAVALGGCHSYSPAPVDLRAHAREFAARLATVREAGRDATAPSMRIDLDDGVDWWEGRRIALWLHPDCRLARKDVAIAMVERDEAGRWPDPVLGADLERILETVPHQWLAAADVGFTLPLSGRLAAERDLAAEEHGAALAAALAIEHEAQIRSDRAFATFGAHHQRADLLRHLVQRLSELESIANRLAEAQELTRPAARAFLLERVQREGELALAESAVAAAALELKRSLGLHPDAEVRFVPRVEIPPRVPAGTRREELFASPRLLSLEARHRTSERALALAVRAQWPDLVLRPGFAEEDAQPRVTLGFTLPLPLFSGNTARIRTAEAERDRAAEALRCGYEALVQDLSLAELRLHAAERHAAFVARELLPLAARQVEDCRKLAELGQLEPLLILDAVVRDHDARMLAVEAALHRTEAAVTMNALFGDLFGDPLASPPVANPPATTPPEESR